MNQKKAKAIRRTMKKIHGYTKSSATNPVQIMVLPIVRIFTESKFKKVYKAKSAEFSKQLGKMGVVLPFEIFFKRVTREFPDTGTLYKGGEKKEAHAAVGRKAYQNEKKQYTELKKKQRSGRY